MAYTQAIIAMTLALSSAPAGGQSGSSATGTKPAAQDQAVKYCIETEPFTGSKLIKTECHTRAEWANQGVDIDQLVKH